MLPLYSATVLSTCWINEYVYEGRNGQENSQKTLPIKNHKKLMRWKLGSIQPAVNESPPCCLKTHSRGFTESSVLEEETPKGEGSHTVSIPHTGSSASNLDQVTIMFCLTISSKLVSCFPSSIPMIHICLHSRQRFFFFFLFFKIWLYLNHAESSSLTRDRTHAPCIGSTVLTSLDHQASSTGREIFEKVDQITWLPTSCCSTNPSSGFLSHPLWLRRSDLILPLPVSLISSLSSLLVIPELQPHSRFFPFKQIKFNPASAPLHSLFPQLGKLSPNGNKTGLFCQPGQGSFHLWFSQVKVFQIRATACPSH